MAPAVLSPHMQRNQLIAKAYIAAAVVSPFTTYTTKLTHRNVGKRHCLTAYMAPAVVSPHTQGN